MKGSLGQISPFAMAALWFGAAVSMAEILTGGLLVAMDPQYAWLAIGLGHGLGALVFFGAARLSWTRDRGAIAVCADSFGRPGTALFGSLNVLQLLGWTTVMIIAGADSMNRIITALGGPPVDWLWKLVLGAVLVAWVVGGLRHDSLINKLAAVFLLGLTAVTAIYLFGGLTGVGGAAAAGNPIPAAMPFGAGLELVVIMPLSWLPLVGDYTRPSRARGRACLVAALAYAAGSSWMYLVGYGSAIHTGSADPTTGLLANAGIIGGVAGLVVIVLSTVTTAFLDVLSAGVSAKTVLPSLKEAPTALVVAGLGTGLAIVVPMDHYQDFLYLIGSVFAPLYAVLLASRLTRRIQKTMRSVVRSAIALLSWAAGLVLYYLLLNNLLFPNGTPLGISIPVMAAVAVLHILLSLGAHSWKNLRSPAT